MAVFSNFISGNDNKFLLLYNIRPMGALIHWFFIGYWINTGSDFHLGPFLFLPRPVKSALVNYRYKSIYSAEYIDLPKFVAHFQAIFGFFSVMPGAKNNRNFKPQPFRHAF